MKSQAIVLLKQLEQERGTDILGTPVKTRPTTQTLLAAKPELKVAFVRQVVETFAKLGARKKKIPSSHPWFYDKNVPNAAATVAQLLLRRRLPFTEEMLAEMLEQIAGMEFINFAPALEQLVRELEQRVAEGALSLRIRQAATRVADGLLVKEWARADALNWGMPAAKDRKLAGRIERVLTVTAQEPTAAAVQTASKSAGRVPSANPINGHSEKDKAARLREARTILMGLEEFAAEGFRYHWKDIESHPATKTLLSGPPELQRGFVVATVDRISELYDRLGKKGRTLMTLANLWHEDAFPKASVELAKRLLRRNQEFAGDEVVHLVERLARLEYVSLFAVPVIGEIVSLCEKHAESVRRVPDFSKHLSALQSALVVCGRAAERKLSHRIGTLLAPPRSFPVYPGEAWSDAALADLKTMPQPKQSAWERLLTHCQTASGGTPAGKWLTAARALLKGVGQKDFKTCLQAWLPLVNEPRTQPITEWLREHHPDPNQLIIEPHANILKGLAWCCSFNEDKDLARALTALALSAYRKIPLKGPREVKIGNACVTALGLMPGLEGVYQLAVLKVRVKFGTAQKFIETALHATAARVGIPRSELEEMAVPAYGLMDVGRCTEKLGDFTAELTVTGTDSTALTWTKADGKRQQSVPAVVKEKFADDLKELQSAAKDIQRMLPAQRERMDNLFREQKTWPCQTWRERYLDHPLVGVLARRLIWEFTTGDQTLAGIFFQGALVDLDLQPLAKLGADTSVRLWHPIGKTTEEIVAWRGWLEAQQIRQPFKQAHREVYLLTDAERRTRTYSNRFAAHILRQHQFNALCAARGWKNKLRLMVDAEFPPATVHLPPWNLRAEFWVEGVGEDFGTDTNDTGVFLRLATDQVRFYRTDASPATTPAGNSGPHAGHQPDTAEPLPLEQVPPLAFSEVMRDVDLFVGVASVGNDPTWSDGGPEGRYRDYWQSYSFGELNAIAQTRREVLERLVPRLKIASQCAFEDKFLMVKGSLRTYKIHLGSGNILMTPNDQYLCIVPKQSGQDSGEVLLPFEGDRTLSVILSKAFLLAEDTKIKDETITRQIRQHCSRPAAATNGPKSANPSPPSTTA